MDSSPSPADWTASALFSPSKARAQQAQAKDWAYVDAWLVRKYGKRLPVFERNEQTLQALLTLVTLNENADEQRSLVEKVEKSVLQTSFKRDQGDEHIHKSLLASLSGDGENSLNALAEANVLLGTSGVTRAAEELCHLATEHFELNEQVMRADAQQGSLTRNEARLKSLLHELREDTFKVPSELPDQTVDWMRTTKHMKAKVAEYDERLGMLRSTSVQSPSIEDVGRQMSDFADQRAQMDAINAELSAFDSLPSNPKVARAKLESARNELRSLTTTRDKLFEGLVGNR